MMIFKRHKNKIIIGSLFVIIAAIFLFALTVGSTKIYFSEVTDCLHQNIDHMLFGTPITLHPFLNSALMNERLPRVLAGALIGAALAAAGVIYQGIFRNPMVSPDFLGASTGAGFGAALTIALGGSSVAIMTNSFLFGLLAVGLAYSASLRSRGNPMLTLLLAGIMISALFDSALMYLEATVDTNSALPSITFWLMGRLYDTQFPQLGFVFPFMLAGFVLLFFMRWPVNLLTMGEDEARSMGSSTHWVRILAIIAATLITASSVSICGKIGWIGLVIPHFSRLLVGYDYRILLPTSMLMGSAFLMLVDILARYWGVELPLGMLTAFVGAPFFLYLLLSRRYKM